MTCEAIEWNGLVIRLVLGGILLLSAMLKLLRGQAAASAMLEASGLASRRLRSVLLNLSVPVEAVLGLFVLWPVKLELSLLLIIVVVAGLTLSMHRALRRGYRGGCGCFGDGGKLPVGWYPFLRNGLIVAASFAALVLSATSTCASYVLPSGPVTAWLAAGAIGATGFALGALHRSFAIWWQRAREVEGVSTRRAP